jgi:hypothetical protein
MVRNWAQMTKVEREQVKALSRRDRRRRRILSALNRIADTVHATNMNPRLVETAGGSRADGREDDHDRGA